MLVIWLDVNMTQYDCQSEETDTTVVCKRLTEVLERRTRVYLSLCDGCEGEDGDVVRRMTQAHCGSQLLGGKLKSGVMTKIQQKYGKEKTEEIHMRAMENASTDQEADRVLESAKELEL